MTTYMGATTNRGRIVVGAQHPGEGYAVVRCGGTEVQIPYTLLHHMRVTIDGASLVWGDLVELQRALDSITAEAAEGHTG